VRENNKNVKNKSFSATRSVTAGEWEDREAIAHSQFSAVSKMLRNLLLVG